VADDRLDVRPYRDRDLPAVLELLKISLGESVLLRRTPELFAWKHLDNPFGRSIMLVSHSGDTIAGFRAFMRWELRTPDGKTLRCVRAVDTVTHPDFRRRGIFKDLTLAAVEAATSDGVDLIFNTPNPRSGAGYLTMGWTEVGKLSPLVSPARGLLRTHGDSTEPPSVPDFVSRGEAVGARAAPDREPVGLRTPRADLYHSWRYTSHPTARYVQVSGAGGAAIARLSFRGKRRELLISDVYGEGMRQTIGTCRNVARTSYVGAYFSKGSPERTAANRAGLVPIPRVGLTLMTRPLRPLDVDVTDLSTWDLALGDLELL
jgi:GNAT superfamily N-acetyltransferase